MPVRFDDEDVTRLRIALGRTVRDLDRQTNVDDMSRTQLTVLGTIARNERLGLAELAEYEGINPTMLSRIVGKLEEQGLVQRVQDETDRRVTRAEITRSGAAFWTRARGVRTKLLTELLAQVPPQEAAALLAAIPALEALAELIRPTPERL